MARADERLKEVLPNPLHPLSFRDFRYFWGARLCSVIAMNCLVIAIGWQVYDIARQTMEIKQASLQLGVLGIVQFAPVLALTLITGWIVDMIDRRIIARLSIALQLICAVILAWLSFNGTSSLPMIFIIAAVLGGARAFYMPALNALAPNLVPKEVLPRAIATNSIAARLGGILGPAIGGYAYAAAPHWAYMLTAILYGIALLGMFMVRPTAKHRIEGNNSPLQQMIEGFRYVRTNALLLGAMSLDLFAVLFGGVTAMLPVFARDILMVGPSGLGQLRMATATGAVLTALWFSYRPIERHVGSKMLIAVGVFGAVTIAFGLSTSMLFSLLCLAILGVADMVSVFVRQSMIQMSTPNEMRGRVGAISTLSISASNELGEAESGFLAAFAGPVAAVVVGGVGSVAIALLWARWFPALRQAQNFNQPSTAA
jgi:MFS family permease